MKNYKLLLTLLAFVVACNKGTDPKNNYSDIKSVPKHSNGNPTQDVLLSPFTFKMMSNTDLGVATFVAGSKEPGKIKFEVSPARAVTKYRVEVVTKPDGSVFSKTSDANIYVLTWNPDRQEPATKVTFQFRAIVEESAEPRQVGKGGESEIFVINVDKQANQPKIIGFNRLFVDEASITKLSVGETRSFILVGEDPSASPQNPPELVPLNCTTGNNKESPKFNGHKYLSHDSTEAVPGTNKFNYHITIDLNTQDIKDTPDKEGFEICFRYMLVNNDTGRRSGDASRNIKVLYEPAKPIITLTSSGDETVRAGNTSNVTFRVDGGREVGKLEVKWTDVSTFPGKAEVKNSGTDKPNKVMKTLKWEVADNEEALAGEYTFRVDATNTVRRNGEDVKSSSSATVKYKVVKTTNVAAPRTAARRTPPSAVPEVVPSTVEKDKKVAGVK